MFTVEDVIDPLREAIEILKARQFPREERAALALEEMEMAKERIKQWEKEG